MEILIEAKYKAHRNRSLRNICRNESGAIDLASIMVGIIVIGMIGGVIAATVFAVIPWTQDNAAKHQLESIVAAESAYFGLSAATPSPLPAGHKANSFGKSAELETAKLLSTGSRYCVTTSPDSKTYTGYSQSSSGTIFYVTDQNSKANVFIGSLPSDCSFISEGITEAVTPPADAPYIDPTPTTTKMTFQCAGGRNGKLPIKGNLNGTLTWTDSANNTSVENYTNALGTANKALTSGVTYTATFEGTYDNLTIDGSYPTLVKDCLLSLDHLGEGTGVKSLNAAFNGATRLTSVPERIPSTVTNLNGTFRSTPSFNSPNISKWNTGNVTDFGDMFYQAASFNQPVNNWDMSKAQSLGNMFMFASKFDQPLDKWDVSNVTNMRSLFNRSGFNQPLNSWNVSKVKFMNQMFSDSIYNHPLDRWNVSNVTDMQGMFGSSATKFNQDISGWDVSKVTNMDSMFFAAPEFYQDLSKWNTAPGTSHSDFYRGSKLSTNSAFQPVWK